MAFTDEIRELIAQLRNAQRLLDQSDLSARGESVSTSVDDAIGFLQRAEATLTPAAVDVIDNGLGGLDDLIEGNPTTLDGTLTGGNPVENWVTYGQENQRALVGKLRQSMNVIEDGEAWPEDVREFKQYVSQVVATMEAGEWSSNAPVNLNEALALERRIDSGEVVILEGNPTTLDGTLTGGNPGEGTLHGMLSEVADHVDYEAEVVAAAADQIEDDDIAEVAADQAEAMKDAADVLEDAAEAARETAAEVFNATGTAQDDTQSDPDIEDVRDGNPTGFPEGMRYQVVPEGSVNVLGDWPEFYTKADAVKSALFIAKETGQTFWVLDEGELVQAISPPATPLVIGNPGVVNVPVETEPVPDSGHVELVPVDTAPPPPEPTTPDTPPEPSHWYTKPMFGRKA